MRFLLDTNALLWWLIGSLRLGSDARRAIADPRSTIYVSAVSAWEVAIKRSLGRLPVPANVAAWLPTELAVNGFRTLPITVEHATAVEHLPLYHRDPFDRLLIAQAQLEALTIVTGDRTLERYAVPVLRC